MYGGNWILYLKWSLQIHTAVMIWYSNMYQTPTIDTWYILPSRIFPYYVITWTQLPGQDNSSHWQYSLEKSLKALICRWFWEYSSRKEDIKEDTSIKFALISTNLDFTRSFLARDQYQVVLKFNAYAITTIEAWANREPSDLAILWSMRLTELAKFCDVTINVIRYWTTKREKQ